jgi:hypothetical protein
MLNCGLLAQFAQLSHGLFRLFMCGVLSTEAAIFADGQLLGMLFFVSPHGIVPALAVSAA